MKNTADAVVDLSEQVRQAKMATLFSLGDGSEEGAQLPCRPRRRRDSQDGRSDGRTEGAVSSVTAEPDVLNLKWRREGNKLLLLPAVEEVRHSGGVGRHFGCGRRRQGLRELLTHTKCGIQQQSLSPLPRSTLHPSSLLPLHLHFKSKSLTLPLPRQFPPRESRAVLLLLLFLALL